MQHHDQIKNSPLYSEDLAPIPPDRRTWGLWDLAALWVGIAVCIPTYLLASYMIKSGLSWLEAICIIGLGNLIITLPMVLNGKAGVQYGLPFPVLGRAAFGIKGVHIAALMRGLVACGWFGIQTWLGGLSIHAIACALAGVDVATGLTMGKFLGFAAFWFINIYFIWQGTERIKWLEEYSAPILIVVGLVLIGWGWHGAGGFGTVLRQSSQLASQTATIDSVGVLTVQPIRTKEGSYRASHYKIYLVAGADTLRTDWLPVLPATVPPAMVKTLFPLADLEAIRAQQQQVLVQFKINATEQTQITSSFVRALPPAPASRSVMDKIWIYIGWLTAMVGFWATMSISISDITRYTATQRNQVWGQFLGLPGTMILYSFVGIFVTCAALINFEDVLVAEDAPWDPIQLLSKFENPIVVIFAQLSMLIATLSTNIAANIIAPAFAFANLFPKQLSFRSGGIVAGLVGIVLCPWWLMDSISNLLIIISGLLGAVLGVLMADYFVVRRQQLDVVALFDAQGIYKGFNTSAMLAMCAGMLVVGLGIFIPSLAVLYNLSWFVGFGVSFGLHSVLSRRV